MSAVQRVPVPKPVIEVFDTLRSSASLVILTMGVTIFFAGYVLGTVTLVADFVPHAGVWSAVFAVWGSALMIFGGTVYAIIWWSYQ